VRFKRQTDNNMTFEANYLQTLRADERPPAPLPYGPEGSDEAVELHLQKVVNKLRALPGLTVTADFDSYGSGYASYVDVLLTKTDGLPSNVYAERNARGTVIRALHEYVGLRLYVCLLAPFAAMGPGRYSQSWQEGKVSGGSTSFLEPAQVNKCPPGDWKQEWRAVQEIVEQAGIRLLSAADVAAELPFTAIIDSNIGSGRQVFDCFFHWND
jgi:hypothetical protein